MAEWLGDEPGAVVIIWDGATWHRAKSVQAAAAKLGLTLIPVPAYSPDLNPIENLWRWCEKRSHATTAINPCVTSSMLAKPSSTVSMPIPTKS